MPKTPKMLNWLCRYALATSVVLDERGELAASLLDVGCGPHGFACAKPDSPFVGVDMSFPLPAATSMLAVRNAPGPLPFADASFETVLSLDVLEHVPPGDRSAFVAELTRVSARRVVIACPTSEGAAVDDLIRAIFVRAGLPLPGWLSEHDEFGLPTPAEVAEHCAPPAGFSSRQLAGPNGLVSTMASVLDFLPETSGRAAWEATEHSTEWIELFEGAGFGDSWRKAYLLERNEPATPAVAIADLEATTLTALRCLRCGGEHRRLGPALLRCIGCGRLAARDTMRAWDVRPGANAFWCEPTWRPDALAPLLQGFAELDDPDASLKLRAAPGTIGGEDALVCAKAALGGRELPQHVDVAIVTEALSTEQEAAHAASATVVDRSAFELLSPVP